MIHVAKNPELKGFTRLIRNTVYVEREHGPLTYDLLQPWMQDGDTESRFPLIVFIQGSAWHCPDRDYNLLHLARFADAGFVVASINHRNIDEGDPAPAYLMDAKTAVRYFRAHAAELHIDPSRVLAYGTSSGGNTALLMGLTGDDPAYRTEDYPEQSDAVQGVMECFGPTDLWQYIEMAGGIPADENREPNIFDYFCGGRIDEARMREMSPICRIEEGKKYCPFFVAHGSGDTVVPFDMSERFVKKLEATGTEVNFLCVDGANHEGDFWSKQVTDLFLDFAKRQAGI